MSFSYKCFTFSQPFSQFPNKFYNRKFQNTHLTQPKIKIKPFIHNISRLEEEEIVRDRSGKCDLGTNGGLQRPDWERERSVPTEDGGS